MTQQPPQSQIPPAGSASRRDQHRQRSSHVPGDDPGTLMDVDSLTEGGPDAVDAAEPERTELAAEQRINTELNEGDEVHADSTADREEERAGSGVEGNEPDGDPERILRP